MATGGRFTAGRATFGLEEREKKHLHKDGVHGEKEAASLRCAGETRASLGDDKRVKTKGWRGQDSSTTATAHRGWLRLEKKSTILTFLVIAG